MAHLLLQTSFSCMRNPNNLKIRPTDGQTPNRCTATAPASSVLNHSNSNEFMTNSAPSVVFDGGRHGENAHHQGDNVFSSVFAPSFQILLHACLTDRIPRFFISFVHGSPTKISTSTTQTATSPAADTSHLLPRILLGQKEGCWHRWRGTQLQMYFLKIVSSLECFQYSKNLSTCKLTFRYAVNP